MISFVFILNYFLLFKVIQSNYLEYCSKNMKERNIPSLESSLNQENKEKEDKKEDESKNYQLKQVQVIIRHGSRTPYRSHICWKGYNVKWNNCNVTELMESLPSSSSSSSSSVYLNNENNNGNDNNDNNDNNNNNNILWRFRKLYDVFPNQLGGNCLTGQLISEGYEQEVINGKILKSAYIGAGNLKLFNTSIWEDLDTNSIYFRSDDEQRTLMSGQILTHSMFDLRNSEIIDWHTGDYVLDTISPNPTWCPILTDIENNAIQSQEYKDKFQSTTFQDLQKSLDQVLGSEANGDWSWRYLQDCLMTTICSGKKSALPPDLTEKLISDAVTHMEEIYAFKCLYNNSRYSKLALSNTVYRIRTRIESVINSTSPSLKFVLYAGHDTTISPILAALLGNSWDRKWPPYASLLSIELYQHITNLKYYFRIVYNGRILKLPTCPSSLCEIKYLLNALSFGRDGHLPECFHSSTSQSTLNPSTNNNNNNNNQIIENNTSNTNNSDEMAKDILLTTGEWILLTILTSIFSSLIGAFIYMTATKQNNYHSSPSLSYSSHSNSGSNVQKNYKYNQVPIHDRL